MSTPDQQVGADVSNTAPHVDTSAPVAWGFMTDNGTIWDVTTVANVAARWALHWSEDRVVALYAGRNRPEGSA